MSSGTRTPGPRLRRPLLYPTELQAHARRTVSHCALAQHSEERFVSADRYVLYHCGNSMSTDFSQQIIDKNRRKRYAFRVRGEQTVAGLRA